MLYRVDAVDDPYWAVEVWRPDYGWPRGWTVRVDTPSGQELWNHCLTRRGAVRWARRQLPPAKRSLLDD